MSKWCETCHRNEMTGQWKSCNHDCPVLGKYFEDLASVVVSIDLILKDASGVADNQEFGLSYGQATAYLDDIKRSLYCKQN